MSHKTARDCLELMFPACVGERKHLGIHGVKASQKRTDRSGVWRAMVTNDNVIALILAEHARRDEFAILKRQRRWREVLCEDAMYRRREWEDANSQQVLFACPFLGLDMGN